MSDDQEPLGSYSDESEATDAACTVLRSAQGSLMGLLAVPAIILGTFALVGTTLRPDDPS
ncbi:hypothetical protein [Herbiconiux liukaitaii]|uniref:hypothetical protein n=1 Tax=Herbiconiux liukaitaii TaxID=3342799 RepID=UPI0035B9F0AB